MTWSASQYTRFEDERTRPVRDLLAAIPDTEARTAIDLGCGPGNSTELLAARFPGSVVTGLDSDPDMLGAARLRLPALRFAQADIAAWDPPETFDIVFSNAALQWVPGHESLYPRLAGRLAPGGSLAIQIPDNLDEPAHRLMREVAAEPRFAPELAGATSHRAAATGAGGYYALLRPHVARVDIWRTTYHHVLPGGPAAVVEWFKGSGLRPFLSPLDAPTRAAFLDRYLAGITEAYPALPDGSVLLPFPRLFLVATASG